MERTFVSDQDVLNAENSHGGLKLDAGYRAGSRIRLSGTYYEKGLTTHAPESGVGRVEIRVPPDAASFTAVVGLLEECVGRGDVNIQVNIDEMVAFPSTRTEGSVAVPVKVDVRDRNVLTLHLDNGDNPYYCDQVAWAEAGFQLK